MHALVGTTMVTRDEAALEPAVDDMAVAPLDAEHPGQCVAQRGGAARAIDGAEIERGQPAFEEPRRFALDAVAVEQHDMPVFGTQARQLGLECDVIGPPPLFGAPRDLGVVRGGPVQVERVSGEEAGRAEFGVVRAGIHRRVVGRAVQVDHVARHARLKDARAQIGRKGVEALQVPVGVLDAGRTGHVAAAKIVGNGLAAVREADQQRCGAAQKLEGGMFGGHGRSRSAPTITRWQA